MKLWVGSCHLQSVVPGFNNDLKNMTMRTSTLVAQQANKLDAAIAMTKGPEPRAILGRQGLIEVDARC